MLNDDTTLKKNCITPSHGYDNLKGTYSVRDNCASDQPMWADVAQLWNTKVKSNQYILRIFFRPTARRPCYNASFAHWTNYFIIVEHSLRWGCYDTANSTPGGSVVPPRRRYDWQSIGPIEGQRSKRSDQSEAPFRFAEVHGHVPPVDNCWLYRSRASHLSSERR